MSKIYLQTMVYNVEKTIHRCINSVIQQTYAGELDWHILDNGSTDQTYQILIEYRKRYSFIHVSHIDLNCSPQNDEERWLWEQFCIRKHLNISDDDFYCTLDGDDELKLDFFEKMIAFMEANKLDIAAAGNDFIDAETEKIVGIRKLPETLILASPNSYEKYFPIYHAYMRPVWGKLYKGFTIKNYVRENQLLYGNDTHFVFHTLRCASRTGILKESLYKYYVSKKSVSYRYSPGRFFSDTYLYNDAVAFLLSYGSISLQNRDFLQCVYANAITDTVGVINNSTLLPEDKLREYCTIAAHPLTQAAYHECTYDAALQSRANLLQATLYAGRDLNSKEDQNFQRIMQILSPHCGPAVSIANVSLFIQEQHLQQALLQDNPDPILETMLARIEQDQSVKKFAISEAVQALAMDRPLLCQITDTVFLRKYTEIYRMLWYGKTLDALEKMTGLLLENQVTSRKEAFLWLYVSLSAIENQAPAFVFGKIQLARLYLRQNRRKECQAAISELTEMGVDNDELAALRHKIEGEG